MFSVQDSKWTSAVACAGACAGAAVAYFVVTSRGSSRGSAPGALPFKSEQKGTGDHAHLDFERLPVAVMRQRATDFHSLLDTRRTVRFFSSDVPPMDVLEKCILAAGTAPSGAHLQPWFFAVVKDPALKAQIRADVEAEEQQNYDQRMKKTWVDDVKGMVAKVHQGDTVQKPYLTEAPYLVVLFKQTSSLKDDGSTQTHYYASESTGIAAGMFLAALHNANLTTLTSTPMGAEAKIRKALGRPDSEKVFLLLPVGWPAEDATVPNRARNGRKEVASISKVF